MSCLWPQARMYTSQKESLHISVTDPVFQPLSSVPLGHCCPLKQTLGVKHLENDLNPIHSQPLFTCHKKSLTMIFLHLESQFSDKEKNSHTHTLWRYSEILEIDSQVTHGSTFFSLFSLHPLWEMNIWPCYLLCPPSFSYHTRGVNSEPIQKGINTS